MDVREFVFDLPPDLIAQEPPRDRGGARLLHLDRATGGKQLFSREQIAETAEELGCGIDREVGAVSQRMLKRWSEQSVVNGEFRMRGMPSDCGGGLLCNFDKGTCGPAVVSSSRCSSRDSASVSASTASEAR